MVVDCGCLFMFSGILEVGWFLGGDLMGELLLKIHVVLCSETLKSLMPDCEYQS